MDHPDCTDCTAQCGQIGKLGDIVKQQHIRRSLFNDRGQRKGRVVSCPGPCVSTGIAFLEDIAVVGRVPSQVSKGQETGVAAPAQTSSHFADDLFSAARVAARTVYE